MYRAGRNKLASRYLDKVRLGHTEPSSYVIIFLFPVAPALAEQDTQFPLEDPFGRRVTQRLVSRLHASRQVVDLFNPWGRDFGEFESRFREGISTNLSRSVALLVEPEKVLMSPSARG